MARPFRTITLWVVVLVAFAGAVGSVVWRFLPHLLDRERDNSGELDTLKNAPLATAPPAAETGWPQWFGPHRDGRAPDGPLRADWDQTPPTKLWGVPCGGGYSSFAAVGGRLFAQDYTGGNERLLCLDAASGKTVWVHESPADYAGFRQGYGTGPRATPTVHDGRVYAVGATGSFVCVENADAGPTPKVLWKHDLAAEFRAPVPTWGFASSPLIEGDLVLVQPGGKGGSVAAFDRKTGDLRWTAGTDPVGYSSPVAATIAGVRQVVAVTGASVLGIRPADGQILWKRDWRTQHGGNIATPLVVGEYVFVSSNYQKGCALFRIAAKGDGATAEEVYFRKNRVMMNHHATSVHRCGFLFGFTNASLTCVNLRTGETVEDWEATRLDKGNVILAGDKLLGVTERGTLFLVDADPKEFRLRGKVDNVLTGGGDCWALPVLLDGRIYLRDATQILCYDVRPVEGKK